jgi:hypothetical protein
MKVLLLPGLLSRIRNRRLPRDLFCYDNSLHGGSSVSLFLEQSRPWSSGEFVFGLRWKRELALDCIGGPKWIVKTTLNLGFLKIDSHVSAPVSERYLAERWARLESNIQAKYGSDWRQTSLAAVISEMKCFGMSNVAIRRTLERAKL